MNKLNVIVVLGAVTIFSVLPLYLMRDNSEGGYSTALGKCHRYVVQLKYFNYKNKTGNFTLDEFIKGQSRADLGLKPEFGIKDFWILKFDSFNSKILDPVVICTTSFADVPRPVRFAFSSKTNSYACGYFDGSVKLIYDFELPKDLKNKYYLVSECIKP